MRIVFLVLASTLMVGCIPTTSNSGTSFYDEEDLQIFTADELGIDDPEVIAISNITGGIRSSVLGWRDSGEPLRWNAATPNGNYHCQSQQLSTVCTGIQ